MVKLLDGTLTAFPVAGTRKRGKTAEEDQVLERELLADEKERAEHNMLVDLARNDIGKLAEYGSVKVEDYMSIHRFSKVMHIASVVTGNLDVCIAIRTAVKKGGKLYVQAGAGIVADSVPEKEYEECANKAGAVIEAVRRAGEVQG